MVECVGVFKLNLYGFKEVLIVCFFDQMFFEMMELIFISCYWEDQLYYDIMILGKSFFIGVKIFIVFKFMFLVKVQVYKFKVFVIESIEYWINDCYVMCKDLGRKILLLEKVVGKFLDK